MVRKNRKKKNRNNDSSTGAGGNIRNITNSDVATTTTTTTTVIMRFTAKQLGFTKKRMNTINEIYKLTGYPKSMEFARGYKHYCDDGNEDKAIASFQLGAETNGCVGCVFFYADLQRLRGNIHLAIPFYVEGSIRGHAPSMHQLVECYYDTKPEMAQAFQNFWKKIMIELGYTIYSNEKERLAWKKKDQSTCIVCAKKDSKDIILKKCGGCRYLFYCGTACQLEDWHNEDGGGNHMGECRQLKILKQHYRRDVKEIREAIIGGDNPKTIVRLQNLRTLLGLNRPKEDYDELLSLLSDDDKNDSSKSPNRYEYLTARKDGTVWIGSTPNTI